MMMLLGLLVLLLFVIVMMRIWRGARGSSGSNWTFRANPTVLTGEVSPADPTTRLKQLQDMRNSGLITNDEYEAKRTQILDKL